MGDGTWEQGEYGDFWRVGILLERYMVLKGNIQAVILVYFPDLLEQYWWRYLG